jgi:CheY-like chemotaxis protein
MAEKHTILLIEDHPDVRKLMAVLLERSGDKIVQAQRVLKC